MTRREAVALGDDYRDVPFPDLLDDFIWAFEWIASWRKSCFPLPRVLLDDYWRMQSVYASRLRATPGFERLKLICNRETGEDPDSNFLRRVRGSIGTGNVTLTEAAERFEAGRALADGTLPPAVAAPTEAALTEALDPAATEPPPIRADSQPASKPPTDPVAELLRKGKKIPAALVKYMQNRESAPFDEIAHHVHGDGQTGPAAIRKNVTRTNNALVEMGIPLRFTTSSESVFKKQEA
jgi:hypothetical protein